MNRIHLAVDAMGGDFAPKVIIEGVINSLRKANLEYQNDLSVTLVGDEAKILSYLEKHSDIRKQIKIHHTDQAIPMDAKPKDAIIKFPKASMIEAAKLVANKEADALISAGNTGALVLSSAQQIPRIKGVHRTALAAVYPTKNELKRRDRFSLILDVGANVFVESEHLVHFALMGAAYAKEIKNIELPTVALLNMGAESNKGGERYTNAYEILSSLPDLNFIGNIEGNDLMRGVADVVVTEGFIGNIAIKTMEGAAETVMGLGKYAFKKNFIWKMGLIFLSSGIKGLKRITDYQEYGGAPILGLERLVLKCHGKSTSLAIENALTLTIKAVRDDLTGNMQRAISAFENEFTRPEFDKVPGY